MEEVESVHDNDIGLSHSSYLLESKASEKLIVKRSSQEMKKTKKTKKREAPVVSFVSSVDDEFDIGELF